MDQLNKNVTNEIKETMIGINLVEKLKYAHLIDEDSAKYITNDIENEISEQFNETLNFLSVSSARNLFEKLAEEAEVEVNLKLKSVKLK